MSGSISREELLRGLPARRASVALFAIEAHTARLVDRSRRALVWETRQSVADRERAFLTALADGRDLPVRPTIQDLERYAPEWALLAPPNAASRAAIADALARRHPLPSGRVPRIRRALGLDDPAVADAFARTTGRPLESLYTSDVPWAERLRWARSGAARRLESLPPFWTAFALTLTETVGAGVLAIPIAVAPIGPLAGVALILLLGLVNVLTIAALAESVSRDGAMRYGTTYLGRLVNSFLGQTAARVLSAALMVFLLLMLFAYYVGVGVTLEDVTGLTPILWVTALLLFSVVLIRRDTLDATVASALLVGAVNVALVGALTLLTLPHVRGEHLRHAELPWLDGRPFDGAALALAFGVVLAAYFGHTSAASVARVVLRRDPGGRSLLLGCVAAMLAATALYCVWVLAVNGAIAPAALADAPGTALEPLAGEVGGSVHVLGTAFVVLAMGMAAVHMARAAQYQVLEWLPGSVPRRIGVWVSMLPAGLTALLVAILLAADRASFAEPLSFLGTLTLPLVAGVFPLLLVVATRRRGDHEPDLAPRALGHHVFVAGLSALFLAAIVVHGLWIWEAPVARVAALVTALGTAALTLVIVRGGLLKRRTVIEVRLDERGDEPLVAVTASGRRLPVATAVAHGSVHVALPATAPGELKVWTHRIDGMGESEPVPASVAVAGTERESDGVLIMGFDGRPCDVRLALR